VNNDYVAFPQHDELTRSGESRGFLAKWLLFTPGKLPGMGLAKRFGKQCGSDSRRSCSPFRLPLRAGDSVVRSLCIIATVAALSAVLSGLEHAQAVRGETLNWVRTVDGWEHTAVLNPDLLPGTPPALHPFLVASFELGASLFVLLAFPRAQKSQPATVRNVRLPSRHKMRRASVTSEV
jgi:hypothetical protein